MNYAMTFLSALFLTLSTLAAPQIETIETPYLVRDGEPRAEIVIAAERPRMTTLAALELQATILEMSGARLPIVTTPGEELPVKIYVGESDYTRQLGVTAEGLAFGAYRRVVGPGYLVLVGPDKDFVPPEPWPLIRNEVPAKEAEWDKLVGDRTDSAWGYPYSGGFKSRWGGRGLDQLAARYGEENAALWDAEQGYAKRVWLQDRSGSLNAVCGLLYELGVRWYMPGEIGTVVPQQATIPLPETHDIVRPDYDLRAHTWYNYAGFDFEDMMWARRLGMNGAHELLGNMGYAHGLVKVHHRQEMRDKHPEYYALRRDGTRITDYRNGGHVCFSSEGLFRETVNFCRFVFEEMGEPHVSLWPMDGFQHCQCDECAPQTSSDLVWGFVDRVARELYKTHPDRLISCGAYTPYVAPPASIDQFTPNVVVFISNRGRPLMDDPIRWQAYVEQVAGWQAKLAPHHILRVENNRYGLDRRFPVIHPHTMAKDLAFLRGISRGDHNEQSQRRMRWHSRGMDHLTLYVQARYLWNAEQDLEPLLDEYFQAFYGPASEEMETAIRFAEARYSRTDNSRPGGRCDPRNVATEDRVRLVELLHEARAQAPTDSVYAQRIQVIIDEMEDLETLRQQLAEERKQGNIRETNVVATAVRQGSEAEAPVYALTDGLSERDHLPHETSFTWRWDDEALYLDVRCQEPDMDNLAMPEHIWEGDSVTLLIEPPGHSYYQIEINPRGEVFDADRWGGVVTRWSSLVEVTPEHGPDYWRLQVRIPIEQVGGDPFNYVVGLAPGGETPWHFNLARRRVRDGNAETAVFATTPERTLFAPHRFAKLTFTNAQQETP